jgi:hypothetical protein
VDLVPFLRRGVVLASVVAEVDLVVLVDVTRLRPLGRIAVLVRLVVLPMLMSQMEQSCSSPFDRRACLRLRSLIVVGRRGGLGIWMPLSEDLKVETEAGWRWMRRQSFELCNAYQNLRVILVVCLVIHLLFRCGGVFRF